MRSKPTIDELFDRRISYPDSEPQERLRRLIGLDGHISRLTKILSLLVAASPHMATNRAFVRAARVSIPDVLEPFDFWRNVRENFKLPLPPTHSDTSGLRVAHNVHTSHATN